MAFCDENTAFCDENTLHIFFLIPSMLMKANTQQLVYDEFFKNSKNDYKPSEYKRIQNSADSKSW